MYYLDTLTATGRLIREESHHCDGRYDDKDDAIRAASSAIEELEIISVTIEKAKS